MDSHSGRSSVPTSLLIGLATGVATGLWMWGEYALGLHGTRADLGRYTGYLSLVFPVVGAVMALGRVRAHRGYLDFPAGLPHVAALAATAAAALALMAGIYIRWLNPAWRVQAGLSEPAFVLQALLSALVGGGVIGLLVLGLMRRQHPAETVP